MMYKVVAFPVGMEYIATTKKDAEPYAVILDGVSAEQAHAYCDKHNWQIAEHGEKYDLYIE